MSDYAKVSFQVPVMFEFTMHKSQAPKFTIDDAMDMIRQYAQQSDDVVLQIDSILQIADTDENKCEMASWCDCGDGEFQRWDMDGEFDGIEDRHYE